MSYLGICLYSDHSIFDLDSVSPRISLKRSLLSLANHMPLCPSANIAFKFSYKMCINLYFKIYSKNGYKVESKTKNSRSLTDFTGFRYDTLLSVPAPPVWLVRFSSNHFWLCPIPFVLEYQPDHSKSGDAGPAAMGNMYVSPGLLYLLFMNYRLC